MELTNKLKEARENAQISLSQLSKMTGISKSTLQRYETGTTKKIPIEAISLIEEALNLPVGYLMGWTEDFDTETGYNVYRHDNISPIETRKIPLVGEIACGEPICSYDEFDSYVEVGSDIRADFCLKCVGDSMINARINDGDIVFIREQPDVENGEIAAVVIEGDATLKRVYKKPNGILLMAENPDFDPIMLTPEEYPDVRIIGKAVAFQSDIK